VLLWWHFIDLKRHHSNFFIGDGKGEGDLCCVAVASATATAPLATQRTVRLHRDI